MDVKLLLSILNRPWFIQPDQGEYYAQFAAHLLRTGSLPQGDKRALWSDGEGLDFGPTFRVDAQGKLDKEGSVQVIRVNYPIAKYDFCGDPGTQTLQQLLAAADSDNTVTSVVMWIDSPGGQVDGTESLATAVKSSAKAKVSYSDGMLCSAAYWIGSSAPEIIVHGANNGWNATIGSIGTMARWTDLSGKYEREGIKVHTVFATESTDKWRNFLDANAGNYDALRRELDGLNKSFLSAVKINRAGKIDLSQENVLTGKTYNAKEALKFGLIDKIGDFQYAVKRSLQLARQASKNSTQKPMATFPKTKAAAKAEENFEVLNEGIWLTEEHLTSVEAALSQHEAAAAEAATQATAQQQRIDELTAQVSTSLQTITSLQAQVEHLKNSDSGKFTTATSENEDDQGGGAAFDDPNLSMNRAADSLLRPRR